MPENTWTTIDPFATPTDPAPQQDPQEDRQQAARDILKQTEDQLGITPAGEKEKPRELTLAEQLEIHALRVQVVDAAMEELKAEREVILDVMIGQWEQTNTPTTDVIITDTDGDRHKVAKATLNSPKPSLRYEDKEAFMNWARKNRPDLITVTEHPATEAWTEETLNPKALDLILKEGGEPIIHKDDDGKITAREFATEDGEVIPGLHHSPAAAPDKFTLSWGGTGSPGKALARKLLLGNRVAIGTTVEGLVNLPGLEGK